MTGTRLANVILCAAVASAWSQLNADTFSDKMYPAGKHSSKPRGKTAFSQPLKGMPMEARIDFQLGKAMFQRLWVTAPSSTQAADGLGPLYNARSCEACHPNNGRGRPPLNDGEKPRSLLMRLSVPAEEQFKGKLKPEPTYGGQLQVFAIPGIPAEGSFKVSYTERSVPLADGVKKTLYKPNYQFTDLSYGEMHKDVMTSPRLAPQLIGLGLLNRIPASQILAAEDIPDKDGNGISGKANWIIDLSTGRQALGRFGWKAGNPSLQQQNQDAAFTDIGLSVPLFPQGEGECTDAQTACLKAVNGNSPQYDNLEAHSVITNLIDQYVANLSVPHRQFDDQAQVKQGQMLFNELGCYTCHRPSYTLRSGVNSQTIWPYTDLLLHDMGEDLADHRPEGGANGREWRTPPLWGIGLLETVNGNAYYLHDGRARSLLEAILWHGGEAQASKEGVVALNAEQREALLAFVKSL